MTGIVNEVSERAREGGMVVMRKSGRRSSTPSRRFGQERHQLHNIDSQV